MNHPRPRIGIYEPSPGPSGPSRYVEAVLTGLDPQAFEVVLFCRAGGPYRPRPGVELCPVHASATAGGPVTGCPPRRLGRGWRILAPPWARLWCGFARQGVRLARHLRRQPVDLFHTNNTGCEESAVAARLAGVPRILGTFHVDSTYDLAHERAGGRHRALELVSNHCLDAAIAVSGATRRDWVRRTHLPADRVVTIPNGVDPDHFARRLDRTEARRRLGLQADALFVGGVGRLEPAKGFADLLVAIALLARPYPRLRIALAGRGPLVPSLAEQATRLGIADRVHFLGFCPDVRVVYDALDVFVLPSLCEALPYALLEAMAAGLPAVGTRVGGVPEAIVPGETGFVVPARDPAALAAAVRPLLDSAELRERMGGAGRDRAVRHFHERDMVRRTVEVYRDLLRTARRRPAEGSG